MRFLSVVVWGCLGGCIAALTPTPATAQIQFRGNERLRNRPRDAAPAPAQRLQDMPGYPLNPVIGKIVWVDDTGRYAVAWLKQPTPLNDRPLGTHNDTLEPRALLRVVRHKDATRAVGLVVERGEALPGQELILPGARMTDRLSALAPRPVPEAEKTPVSPSQ